MSISIKLYNKIYKQIDTINNKYTMNFEKLIDTNITDNCYDLVKNTKQELKELGDFCVFEYISFIKNDMDLLHFEISIYIENDLFLTIPSDIIYDKSIKIKNNRYIIKLPMDDLIDSNEIYSKIFKDKCNIMIKTNNDLDNIQFFYKTKIIDGNTKKSLDVKLYRLQYKFLKKYSYDEINNILFDDNIFGLYISTLSLEQLNRIKMTVLSIIHDLDEELINLYCDKINNNTYYFQLNLMSKQNECDIKHSIKINNDYIQIDIEHKHNMFIYVTVYKIIELQ